MWACGSMYLMGGNSKHQVPTSRETSNTRLQNHATPGKALELETWSFSGAWRLEVGASFCLLPCANRSFTRCFGNRLDRQITEREQDFLGLVLLFAIQFGERGAEGFQAKIVLAV